MPVGFGIVGCGMIADFHARALAEVRGARLVGCFDNFPKSAKRMADKYEITAYPTLKEMLADDSIDAITVATPSGAHMEPAVAAAKAGKHVVVEKPLEVTLKRCDRIIKACEDNGVCLATIFPSRFHDSTLKMKKAVDTGRFGTLTLGDAFVKWWRTQEYYDSGAWRGTWELDGGGALMNQAIHSVDLLLYLMGPATEVTARTATVAHKRIEVEDIALATIQFESGALGVIEATTAAYPGYLKRIELHGTAGSAVLEEEDIKVWDFAKARATDKAIKKAMEASRSTAGGASDPAAIGHHGHAELFKDFVKAISKGSQPAIDGWEGRRSVELILAIYKSAAIGKAVPLPLKSDPRLLAKKS